MADSSFSSDDGSVPIMMCIDKCPDELMQTPTPSQRSSIEDHPWIQKKIYGGSLTPATVSTATTCSSSLSSCSSPFAGNNSIKEILVDERHDASTCSETSNASNSQQNSTQFQKNQQHLGHQPNHRGAQAVWVPLPSPSKPRLDPRYAARLAPINTSFPPIPSPRVTLTSSRRSSATSSSSFSSDVELMPPPSVSRNSGIFRPTAILAPPLCFDDRSDSKITTGNTRSGGGPNTPIAISPSSQWFSSSARSSAISDVTTPSSSSYGTISVTTPRRPSKRTKADAGVSDRFIPNRATSNFNFNLWDGISSRGNNSLGNSNNSNQRDTDERNNSNGNNGNDSPANGAESGSFSASNSLNTVTGSSRGLLSTLLRSELLGENDNPLATGGTGLGSHQRNNNGSPLQEGGNVLRFRSPREAYQDSIFEDVAGPNAIVNAFSLTPVSSVASQRLMATPPKRKRRISKVPFKVLDAPALQDDFYLNLVDWSSQNVLAVGLGSCVYLWSACTSKVTKLCDLAPGEDIVTSVSWAQRGTHLSVGTNRGEVQLWDAVKCKKVRTMNGHTARVGTLAWTGPILASGSRDRLIYLRDVRCQTPFTDKLTNHKQEVCGLKWSFEEPSFLASGGNDNNLHVIDSRHRSQPLHKFAEHTAAVKAIAWSPHQHGLLASGGGTADRCIRFWNTLSGSSLNKIDTGSQVCNLAWSQNCNEIVSTHGYSLNQIVVWRYPSMTKVTTLTGHTYRVLYLAMSPDGSTIVTGAGDETLRFWQIFPGPRSDGKDNSGGLLFPNTIGSVIR